MRRYVLALTALLTTVAGAHPVDEVVQGAYLTLAPGVVRLELEITPGPQVADSVLKVLDANANGTITNTEARAYAVKVLKQSTLKLNDVAAVWTLDRVEVPPYRNLTIGSDTLKIYATARRTDTAGAQTLSYQNRYQPAKGQWTANVFLLPGAGWQYGVTGQTRSNDGQQLAVNYTVGRP